MNTYLFVVLAIFVNAVFGSSLYPYKSTFYGCPDECETQKNPKCEISIPSNQFFVALHPKYFSHKPYKYCDNYYVGMIIDDKAHGEYKMIRAKVIDQCGSCAETQVDLSQTAFEHIAKKSTGVVNMLYAIIDKDSGEIIDGPHYNSSALNAFAKAKGIEKSTIVGAFKQAAKAMNKDGAKGMSSYPWESGKFSTDDDDEDDYEEKKTTTRKTTTRKTTTTTTRKTTTTTTRKTTTTTTRKTTTTTTTTTTAKKTSTLPFPLRTKATTTAPFPLRTTLTHTTAKATVTPLIPLKPALTTKATVIPAIPLNTAIVNKTQKPVEKEVEKKTTTTTAAKPTATIEIEDELDDFDKANGGTNDQVTAGVIGGTAAVVGAAGVGLLMLKRKSPQKYDDLKQKFPEAFGTVKRSLTRGASTIKRGVSRSVSRRNNVAQNTPLPASYTFTLSSEDGLPRVALYDDPYPTKTHGSQHW